MAMTCTAPPVIRTAAATPTKHSMSVPVTLAPLTNGKLDGSTAFPMVLETMAPENFSERGRSFESRLANPAECFTSGGVIALIAKQKTPANGLSCAPIVVPSTLDPTLAYSIDSTPRPLMLVPIVVEAFAENPRKYEIEDIPN